MVLPGEGEEFVLLSEQPGDHQDVLNIPVKAVAGIGDVSFQDPLHLDGDTHDRARWENGKSPPLKKKTRQDEKTPGGQDNQITGKGQIRPLHLESWWG